MDTATLTRPRPLTRTRRTHRAGASVMASLAFGVLACSSSSQPHPPDLGACIPTAGKSCGSPTVAGGGSSPQGDGEANSVDGGSPPVGEGGSCGVAHTSLLNSTAACSTCVTAGAGSSAGFDCCAADTACATDCVQVISCVQANCQIGDGTCVSMCELATPTGVQAYNDFARCLGSNCSPQCPMLTLGTGGDI